jgi:hypothetical protein
MPTLPGNARSALTGVCIVLFTLEIISLVLLKVLQGAVGASAVESLVAPFAIWTVAFVMLGGTMFWGFLPSGKKSFEGGIYHGSQEIMASFAVDALVALACVLNTAGFALLQLDVGGWYRNIYGITADTCHLPCLVVATIIAGKVERLRARPNSKWIRFFAFVLCANMPFLWAAYGWQVGAVSLVLQSWLFAKLSFENRRATVNA